MNKAVKGSSDPSEGARRTRKFYVLEWLVFAASVVVVGGFVWFIVNSNESEIVTAGSAPVSKIAWRESLNAALEESKTSGKPVLVVFSAVWCGPCQQMKRDVWPDDAVTASVESQFVPVHLDVDDAGSRDAVLQYQVRSIPRLVVVNSDGALLAESGGMPKDATLNFLAKAGK